MLSLPYNAIDYESPLLPTSLYVQYEALRLEVKLFERYKKKTCSRHLRWVFFCEKFRGDSLSDALLGSGRFIWDIHTELRNHSDCSATIAILALKDCLNPKGYPIFQMPKLYYTSEDRSHIHGFIFCHIEGELIKG